MNKNLLFNVDQCAQQQHKRDWGEQTDSDLNNDSAFPPVWKVGDRIAIQPGNLSARRKYLANATGEIKAIKGNKASVLLDEPANKAYKCRTVNIDLCSLIWISSRESEDFQKQQQQLEELGQLNLLNLIQMPNKFCDRASEESPSTQTSGTFPPELENTSYLLWGFPARGQASLEMEPDLTTQNQACGLKPCAALPMGNPTLSSSKILRDLSLEDYEQFLEDSEFADIVGTIHSSYRHRNLARPTKGKGCLSLPTPTTYPKGSGKYRPAGATRLEQSLRKFIVKGDKLHPAAPGWMMGFPPGWVEEILMAGGLPYQPPVIPECDRILPSAANATTSTPVPSVPSKQLLPFVESSTSIPCANELQCTQQLQVGDRTETFAQGNAVSEITLVNFLEDKHKSEEQLASAVSANIECTQQLQVGDRIRITRTRTQNLSQWIGHEATVTGINGETISVAAGEGKEKKHLTLKPGWYEVLSRKTPKNFLEESQEAAASAQQLKPSKQKGCLYRYLENKKLKDGRIATYPRIIEDKREPDNPQHWRWGFNWEEKIDGEWKGRSIGSIPVGAIPMIKSMQNQGVSLEEIIAFIKKSKMKNKT